MKGNFIDNLPKIYGLYTGGFVVFIFLMAVLEQMGLGADTIGILFVTFTVVIYATIGWLSRTMDVGAYYVAGRQVPTVFNGMATAADWMSGASFVAMAGGIYFGGHGYLAFVVGWTGGYILVASLMAPYLRKFGWFQPHGARAKCLWSSRGSSSLATPSQSSVSWPTLSLSALFGHTWPRSFGY